jgi:hypothetical protein
METKIYATCTFVEKSATHTKNRLLVLHNAKEKCNSYTNF